MCHASNHLTKKNSLRKQYVALIAHVSQLLSFSKLGIIFIMFKKQYSTKLICNAYMTV